MQQLVGSLTKDDDGMKELKKAANEGRLNATMIIDEVTRITSEYAVKMVPKEQFENMQAQAEKLTTMVNDLKAFRSETAQK